MKLLRHSTFGVPQEVLELLDTPEAPLKPHEVAIDIEATPIHAGDLQNIAGAKLMLRHVQPGAALDVTLPQIPGIEGIGRVVAVGTDVAAFRPGDRVFLPRQCGSWRQRIHADARILWSAPEGDATQLCLMVNAFTAEFALTDLSPLRAGDWFVQNAANSNVGRFLIALAHRRGIRTVNVVRRSGCEAELRALGADIVIEDGPGLATRVRALVGDAPLDVALDGVAGTAAGRLAECLSDGGVLANSGSMSGEPCAVPTWVLLYRRIQVIGYYAGFSLDARSPMERAKIIGELAALVAEGALRTPIAATYPLERWREAVAHAERSGTERAGKVIFTP